MEKTLWYVGALAVGWAGGGFSENLNEDDAVCSRLHLSSRGGCRSGPRIVVVGINLADAACAAYGCPRGASRCRADHRYREVLPDAVLTVDTGLPTICCIGAVASRTVSVLRAVPHEKGVTLTYVRTRSHKRILQIRADARAPRQRFTPARVSAPWAACGRRRWPTPQARRSRETDSLLSSGADWLTAAGPSSRRRGDPRRRGRRRWGPRRRRFLDDTDTHCPFYQVCLMGLGRLSVEGHSESRLRAGVYVASGLR